MSQIGLIIILLLILWNSFVFLLFGYDKWQAVRQGWRIRERTLLLATFCLGGWGALLAIPFFHHKTLKPYFLLTALFSSLVLVFLIGWYFTYFQ
ncbi:DUF1294 domain-containing protein [Facklamia languida]